VPNTRSGAHLHKRGDIYYYRRMVPQEYRKAFGQVVVAKSLNTGNEAEAKRLEKLHDVDFEERLRAAREKSNPEMRRARIAQDIIQKTPARYLGQWGVAHVQPEDRQEVSAVVEAHYDAHDAHGGEVAGLAHEITQALPDAPIDAETWVRCREGIMAVVRQHVATVIRAPAPRVKDGLHTLGWAFDRWLRAGGDTRGEDVIATTRRHWDAFFADCKLVMLADVRRSHLLAWRDRWVDAGKHKPKSINQRIQLVTAVLRQGWRDAEMAQPDLKALTVPEPDDSGRGAWSRDDILKALNALEPQSWQAWVYLLGLTTSARLGEPVAAQTSWWNAKTGFIEVPPIDTKKEKPHAMPVIECLRGPLEAYVAKRGEGFLFDAPRPKDPKVPISNVASKAMNRLFKREGIDRVFHELRDTWIEEARHSPVKREMWEIISGHSGATVSDRYGGEKPDALAEHNETICRFVTGDAEIIAAVCRLTTHSST
jgi:hypothetical protein